MPEDSKFFTWSQMKRFANSLWDDHLKFRRDGDGAHIDWFIVAREWRRCKVCEQKATLGLRNARNVAPEAAPELFLELWYALENAEMRVPKLSNDWNEAGWLLRSEQSA